MSENKQKHLDAQLATMLEDAGFALGNHGFAVPGRWTATLMDNEGVLSVALSVPLDKHRDVRRQVALAAIRRVTGLDPAALDMLAGGSMGGTRKALTLLEAAAFLNRCALRLAVAEHVPMSDTGLPISIETADFGQVRDALAASSSEKIGDKDVLNWVEVQNDEA